MGITSIERISVSATGEEGDGGSFAPVFSSDGNKVAFSSVASNLVEDDTNQRWDVFVKNLLTGEIERVSVQKNGEEGNDHSGGELSSLAFPPVFSPDGTKIAFVSEASNLVENDINRREDIFVKNLTTGDIERVSISATGEEGDGASFAPVFSLDGTKIAFASFARNLVGDNTQSGPFYADIFIKDLLTGDIEQITNGEENIGSSHNPVFSPDGTKIAFISHISNLVEDDTNGLKDIFVKDLATGEVERVSVSANGEQIQIIHDSIGIAPGNTVFSPDGTKIAFDTWAGNLVEDDTNGRNDIFVKDLATGAVERVSVRQDGGQGDSHSGGAFSFSPDGTKIAFVSSASNLVENDTNSREDIFVKNLTTGDVELVNVSVNGVPTSRFGNENPVFSPDGTKIAFSSVANNLVGDDTNDRSDIFVATLDPDVETTLGFTVRMETPGRLSPGEEGVVNIQYKNAGSKDIAAPVLRLSSEGGILKNPYSQEFSGNQITISAEGSDKDNLLKAGEENILQLPFKMASGLDQEAIFTLDQISEDLTGETFTDHVLTPWTPSGSVTFDEKVVGLPFLMGYGSLSPLPFKMSEDEVLFQEVKSLTENRWELSTEAFHQAFESILYRWAEVDALPSFSRGEHADARKIGFLETLHGDALASETLNESTADYFTALFDTISDTLIVQFLWQGFLPELLAAEDPLAHLETISVLDTAFASLAVDFSENSVEANLSEVLAVAGNLFLQETNTDYASEQFTKLLDYMQGLRFYLTDGDAQHFQERLIAATENIAEQDIAGIMKSHIEDFGQAHNFSNTGSSASRSSMQDSAGDDAATGNVDQGNNEPDGEDSSEDFSSPSLLPDEMQNDDMGDDVSSSTSAATTSGAPSSTSGDLECIPQSIDASVRAFSKGGFFELLNIEFTWASKIPGASKSTKTGFDLISKTAEFIDKNIPDYTDKPTCDDEEEGGNRDNPSGDAPSQQSGTSTNMPQSRSGSTGDPHLKTFDGLGYNFQAAGEFIYVSSPERDFEVQVRQEPWRDISVVSVNTAVAARVGDATVGVYLNNPNQLYVNDSPITLAEGHSIAVGGGTAYRIDNSYTILSPQGDGVTVDIYHGLNTYLNIYPFLADGNEAVVSGLLGNNDGNVVNDLMLMDGIVLPQPISENQLYGEFADSWRVTDTTSLFVYNEGESTATFTDRNFPSRHVTLADLDPDAVAAAREAVAAQGIQPGFDFDNAVLDLVLTGDPSFLNGVAERQNGEDVTEVLIVERPPQQKPPEGEAPKNKNNKGSAGDDVLTGTNESDTINGLHGNDTISGGGGNDHILGWVGDDSIQGDEGADSILGGSGNDSLSGGAANDYLSGYKGSDTLQGGAGADKLHGGEGSDIYLYPGLDESGVDVSTRDRIFDFSQSEGDQLDLSALNIALFIGTDAFSGAGTSEIRYEQRTHSDGYIRTLLGIDANGDGNVDMEIQFSQQHIDFTEADFIL